jgi:hypothetical protein
MCGKVFIKRVLPFFLTFAVGLFIASFFVSITAPKFQFNRGWRKHQQYHRTMEFENQRLREENSRLKKQLADNDLHNLNNRDFDVDFAVPPPPPLPPAKIRTIPYNGR